MHRPTILATDILRVLRPTSSKMGITRHLLSVRLNSGPECTQVLASVTERWSPWEVLGMGMVVAYAGLVEIVTHNSEVLALITFVYFLYTV